MKQPAAPANARSQPQSAKRGRAAILLVSCLLTPGLLLTGIPPALGGEPDALPNNERPGNERPGNKRPGLRNLLLITIDTLRADHLGSYGYVRPTSPHIDELAAKSVVFDAAHSSTSWTLPAIVSLLTGQDSFTQACRWCPASEDLVTLPEILSAVGFHTGAVTSHIYVHSRYGVSQGIADFDEELVRPSERESHSTVSSPEVTRRGLEFIVESEAREDATPWMLWLHYFDPHHSYVLHDTTPASFDTREPIDRYDGEIVFTDHHVGELLRGLTAAGCEENTAVVLIADHGEEFADHGGAYHRLTLYQEVLRVPLMMRIPGYDPRRVSQTVSVVDVMPTVLEFLGQPVPGDIAGRSLVPLLTGAPRGRRPVVASLRNGSANWDAIVDGRWKLLRNNTSKRIDLFDLEKDPREQHNVARRRRPRVNRLLRTLEERAAKARARSEGLAPPAPLQLTPEQSQALEALGYTTEGESR